MLEIAGSVDRFYQAITRIPGLEYLGDEEMEFDADADFAVRDTRKGREGEVRDDRPVGGRLYVAMPDMGALRQFVSLWERYQAGQEPAPGFAPWFDVFRHLYRMRAWGPSDRISEETVAYLNDELAARPDSRIRMEVELWSYRSHERQRQTISRFEEAVRAADGEILHQSSIPEIAYEAALIRSS